MRVTSLSQNGAYSSLDHLAGLGVIEEPTEPTIRGASRKYRPTREGEELLRLLSFLFDLLELVSRMENIEPYLEAPYRSWEILLRTYRDGHVSLSRLLEGGEICKTTARSALRALSDLGQVEMEVKRNIRNTRKAYSSTRKVQQLGKIVLVIDGKMSSLVKSD